LIKNNRIKSLQANDRISAILSGRSLNLQKLFKAFFCFFLHYVFKAKIKQNKFRLTESLTTLTNGVTFLPGAVFPWKISVAFIRGWVIRWPRVKIPHCPP
jgi:hypothetical protein